MGDEAKSVKMTDGSVKAIYTENLGDVALEADNFVLATGSFFAKGLVATPNRIYEPLFDLDVDFDEDRNKWYDPQFFNMQNYMGYGVTTDASFKAVKGGKTIDNLYVVGSVLSGMNALYEYCGSGVSIVSAMYVADSILGR
jgi:glycerol-3-phosphate dehydrogenase subunit B